MMRLCESSFFRHQHGEAVSIFAENKTNNDYAYGGCGSFLCDHRLYKQAFTNVMSTHDCETAAHSLLIILNVTSFKDLRAAMQFRLVISNPLNRDSRNHFHGVSKTVGAPNELLDVKNVSGFKVMSMGAVTSLPSLYVKAWLKTSERRKCAYI